MKRIFSGVAVLCFSMSLFANNSYLVKVKRGSMATFAQWATFEFNASDVQPVANDWVEVKVDESAASTRGMSMQAFMARNNSVEYVQPNFKLNVYKNPNFMNPAKMQAFARALESSEALEKLKTLAWPAQRLFADPKIPTVPGPGLTGADADISKQWGMKSAKAIDAWRIQGGTQKVIVAVIDTGVDYTHPDLVTNMWRNTAEIPDNGIDDDNNGYVDDIVGWDFLSNDNKPFDVYTSNPKEIMNGKNPGHGTHCAGNVGATGNNTIGISGVNQHVSIMALRFIGDEGGTTADAVKAIRYAVDNGAKVLSNSWGSEGEDPSEAADNLALREAVKYAMSKDVLFIAAAGNGRGNGFSPPRGYDNDTDKNPSYPATYAIDNVVSVAAIDSSDRLADFSNFGKKTVHIGAPGVDIYSTVPGGRYQNVVLETMGQVATWDGTSMATPHVAGAAGLILAQHPEYSWKDVKEHLLNATTKISALAGKTVTGGKLNVLDAIQ